MTKIFYSLVFLIFFISCQTFAQNANALKHEIEKIVSNKNARIGIAIMGINGKDSLSINGDTHFPLQSVFKLHIALVVLSEIDQGKFSLNQEIEIEKKYLQTKLYSPIRDKYPNGTTLGLSEILDYSVSQSDNIACDLLLRLIGGPEVVNQYFNKNNIKDVSIKINEEVQQANWDRQFENWTSPKAANEVLSKFYHNNPKLLSEKSHDFIWKTMKGTQTGKARIRGSLSQNAIVAHKTGTSGVNGAGLTAAVNDIGIVFLPNGEYYFISVFVANSRENNQTNEKIISDISKVTWDYFTRKMK